MMSTLPASKHCYILLLLSCVLSSCTMNDPQYKTLIASAEKNPRPDAIVGMWFDTTPAAWSKTRTTMQVQPSGTVFYRTVLSVAPDEPSESTFGWRYLGRGVWTVSTAKDPSDAEWRLSQGRLLVRYKGAFGTSTFVFVRADSDDQVAQEKWGR